jgi:hypothetical protein
LINKNTEINKLNFENEDLNHLNINEIWNIIQKRSEKFEKFRDDSLEKWNRKTKLGYFSSKNFKTINTVFFFYKKKVI